MFIIKGKQVFKAMFQLINEKSFEKAMYKKIKFLNFFITLVFKEVFYKFLES